MDNQKRLLIAAGLLIAFAVGFVAGFHYRKSREPEALRQCRQDLRWSAARGIQMETYYNLCRTELEKRQK